MKPTSALCHPHGEIWLPKIARGGTDYEVELTIVIGKRCRNASAEGTYGSRLYICVPYRVKPRCLS